MFPQVWVPTLSFMAAAMNDLIGYDPSSGMSGILRNVYLALFQMGSPTPTSGSTLSTQTEATYDGYARQEIVWFPTYLDSLGPQSIIGANLQYRPTDAIVPNTITQLGIVTALTGGTLLLLSALFTPKLLSAVTDQLTSAPVFQLSFAGAYGGPLVWT